MNHPTKITEADLPHLREECDHIRETEAILIGVREMVAVIEDDAQDYEAEECAVALRQAWSYLGIAIDKWRRLE